MYAMYSVLAIYLRVHTNHTRIQNSPENLLASVVTMKSMKKKQLILLWNGAKNWFFIFFRYCSAIPEISEMGSTISVCVISCYCFIFCVNREYHTKTKTNFKLRVLTNDMNKVVFVYHLSVEAGRKRSGVNGFLCVGKKTHTHTHNLKFDKRPKRKMTMPRERERKAQYKSGTWTWKQKSILCQFLAFE